MEPESKELLQALRRSGRELRWPFRKIILPAEKGMPGEVVGQLGCYQSSVTIDDSYLFSLFLICLASASLKRIAVLSTPGSPTQEWT